MMRLLAQLTYVIAVAIVIIAPENTDTAIFMMTASIFLLLDNREDD